VRIANCSQVATQTVAGGVGWTPTQFAGAFVAAINAMMIDCDMDPLDPTPPEVIANYYPDPLVPSDRFKISWTSIPFTFEVGNASCSSFCTVTSATPCSFNPVITQIGGSSVAPGQALCFCDAAHGPVPCGNPGGFGEGCRNSSGQAGVLAGEGSASVTNGDLVLVATGALPGQPGLFFQGDAAIADGDGAVFGSGQRCCGQNVARLEVVVPDANGDGRTSVDIAASGGAQPGDTRCYQYWYRDPGGPCASDFNLTNGYAVLWSS
jgi:hypothetical protein